ncbi:hypothetical protein MMC08_006283 [Hypocenomyce scalaris]|nr:hypothetical protein [Hypocenomyce scalaris]
MPPLSTPRRTSIRRDNSTTPPKSIAVDVGMPLGPYDSNSVRDRVRQWQAQGGGVITTPQIYAEDEEEEVVCKSRTPKEDKRTPSRHTALETEDAGSETPEKRDGRRKSGIEVAEGDRIRSVSAPRKRVVSDGHWRKKRSPPKQSASSGPGKGTIHKETRQDDGIRVRPLPDTEAEARHKHDDAGKPSKRESVGGGPGIRVYGTPPGSYRHSDRHQTAPADDSGSRSVDNSDVERPSSITTPSPHAKADSAKRRRNYKIEESPKLGSSAAKDSARRRRSHEQDKLSDKSPRSAQGPFSEVRGSKKAPKPGILSQVFDESKKIFSRQEPVPISPPRIPSIEAWLSETPDPFIDTEVPPVQVEISSPGILPPEILPSEISKSRRRKEAVVEETIPDDPNKIWDAIEARTHSGRTFSDSRRRKRVRSSTLYEDNPFPEHLNPESVDAPPKGTTTAAKLVDLVHEKPIQETPESSPSSLRRRGAKRNPSSPTRERQKPSPLKLIFPEDGITSTLSSSRTASSVEPSDPPITLRPPGLGRRPFPSTGMHRLSTIASVETFEFKPENAATQSVSVISEATIETHQGEAALEARDVFDPDSLARRPSKSRLAKHSDLISVLSLPRGVSRSIRSARSIRTNRSRLATATVGDLMKELAIDESKYMRELRTLVDGVIPVLLTCVLSRADSAAAAGLFRAAPNAKSDPNLTRPIVDMGISLERLKTLHQRVPLEDCAALHTWAQGAQRVYAEYLKAWRMGFQDVVVNLAPAVEDGSTTARSADRKTEDLDQGLPRNKHGDVVNVDGERVDVAFLLKRPLLRLKYLAKTFKGINVLEPSVEAESLAAKYQDLVVAARHRSNEERARLEDEAAASIDPTRARDLRTLAPLNGVSIDSTRRVRARDYFSLTLLHSTGQRVDCRVELLLRDDAPDRGTAGDVLICEVDTTGRWLLLPPVQFGRISARNGDVQGEIIVMIRGLYDHVQDWQELFSLQTDDEQVGFEWVRMLGLTPVPPKISRSQSFLSKHERRKSTSAQAPSSLEAPDTPTTPGKSRTPSPREIDIPIGEQAGGASKVWTQPPSGPPKTPVTSSPRERARLQKKQPYGQAIAGLTVTHHGGNSNLEPLTNQRFPEQPFSPDTFKTPRGSQGSPESADKGSLSGLRRVKMKRLSKHADGSPTTPPSAKVSLLNVGALEPHTPTETSRVNKLSDVSSGSPSAQRSTSPQFSGGNSSFGRKPTSEKRKSIVRPAYGRSLSSVPSSELPSVPKVRKDSPPTTSFLGPVEESGWISAIPENKTTTQLPSKLINSQPDGPSTSLKDPPPPPLHRTPSPAQLKVSTTPTLNPSAAARKAQRRSSSPLKHEYEPSTASESSSDSDASTVEHNEATSVSDSSEDEELEDGDAPTPLLPLGALQRLSKVTPPASLYSLPNGTLSPSNSASQAPYKTVPAQPTKASKTIASIFSWSDKGAWESLHPDECSIVITPGLIEAYEMSAAHSQPITLQGGEDGSDHSSSIQEGERPLVALELTPLVPLRRGTALDISIRSPPTPNSKITSGNNILFRSRNPEECEALYALINQSRINNPTYIALQNARGPYTASSYSSFDRRSSTRDSRRSSWFGLGSSSRPSYRASSAPTPSIAPSESSIGSMSSAFSALKRFSHGRNMFNIARSTISSRDGSGPDSVYTSSDNSSGSGASTPLPAGGAPIGLSNAKIRLYIRETASKWRDMGSARLTITRPTTSSSNPPGSPGGASRPVSWGGQAGGQTSEKRILVNGKTNGEILLDVCLDESRFERVARTGIALSVWEDARGPNGEVGVVGAVGGVAGGRGRVYMIQVCFAPRGFPFLIAWDVGLIEWLDEK